MAPLPPHDQRHLWLRYQVEGYTEEIVYDFKKRLETIFGRQDLAERLRMIYTRDDGQEIFVSDAWRRIGIEMGLDVADSLYFQLGGARRSMTWRQFILALGVPSYTYIRDPIRRLCHSMDWGTANALYLLAQYLFKYAEGRKSGSKLSKGHFIRHLAHHFGLVSDDGLRGLSVVTHDWAWVAQGVERQPVAAAAALWGAKDAPYIDEGAQAVLAPIHAPPPPPPATGRTMPQRLRRLEEDIQGLSGVLIRHSMAPFEGVTQSSLRGVPDAGLMVPAPPQPSRTSSKSSQADLAEKKSTMLVKYLQSGNLEVLES
ncbi:hypothetical protein Tco_0674482 [Tanacetum coccineum]